MTRIKEFSVKSFSCDTFFKLKIFGQFPGARRELNIKWTPDYFQNQPDIPVPNQDAERFCYKLASSGQLDGIFSTDEIQLAKWGIPPRGYSCQYIIPPMLGGQKNERNIRLISDGAHTHLQQALWAPVSRLLTSGQYRFSGARYTLPVFPQIITTWHIDTWKQSNLSIGKFLSRRKEIKQKTEITAVCHDDRTILSVINHPFVSLPVMRIQILPEIPNGRTLFHEDKKLHQFLRRRDAFLLAKLGTNERHYIFRRAEFPKSLRFTMHHLWPLKWGGTNTIGNICHVTSAIHTQFNALVEEPVQSFLETHPELTDKPIYVDFPMPLNAYKSGLNPDRLNPPKSGALKCPKEYEKPRESGHRHLIRTKRRQANEHLKSLLYDLTYE